MVQSYDINSFSITTPVLLHSFKLFDIWTLNWNQFACYFNSINAKPTFTSCALHFIIPGSPYRVPISSAILQLQEAGRLHVLKNRWWKEKSQNQCRVSNYISFIASVTSIVLLGWCEEERQRVESGQCGRNICCSAGGNGNSLHHRSSRWVGAD